MDSIGEKLKAARESNGYTFDQIARDTHIAKRFLMALEEEDYSVFPGEPYILGFLKNYSEFVGLDSHEILSLYKNIKIQEQPVPMEELLEPRSAFPFRIVGIVAAVAVVIAAGYLVYTNVLAAKIAEWQKPAPAKPAAVQSGTTSEIELTSTPLERTFRPGDSISVTEGDTVFKVVLNVDAGGLVLSSPAGPVKLVRQEERALDLDGNGSADLKVLFKDLNEKDPEKMLLLRVERLVQSVQTTVPVVASTESALPLGGTNAASRKQEEVVITKAAVPAPFTVDIRFSGSSLFRYIADGETRQEKYFKTNEVFSMSVRSEIRLWTSNAGIMIVKVAGQSVQLGKVGEVATKLIRWEKDEGTGSYTLKLVPVY